MSGRASHAIKRSVDLMAGLLLLIPLSLPLLVVALTVMATLGRPVFFRQQRLGRGAGLFMIRKFRTMRDLRDSEGRLLPDEARTPRVGVWLRRLRLDELPELANLLSGEMSLVGPRPLLPSSMAELSPFEARRLEMRPGITGWAQVNGNTRLTLQQKAQLDVWYIDHWSLGLDVLILAKTMVVVMKGERVNAAALEEASAYAHRADRGGREYEGRPRGAD